VLEHGSSAQVYRLDLVVLAHLLPRGGQSHVFLWPGFVDNNCSVIYGTVELVITVSHQVQ